jgi:hypothetical protein
VHVSDGYLNNLITLIISDTDKRSKVLTSPISWVILNVSQPYPQLDPGSDKKN